MRGREERTEKEGDSGSGREGQKSERKKQEGNR